jgi:hypothetical protein
VLEEDHQRRLETLQPPPPVSSTATGAKVNAVASSALMALSRRARGQKPKAGVPTGKTSVTTKPARKHPTHRR